MKLLKLPGLKHARKYALILSHPLAPHIFLWLGAVASALVILSQAPALYSEIITHALDVPQVVLIEFLAMLLLIYTFYYVSGIVWFAVGVPSLFVYILCLVNKYKVFLRGDPFMPTDIILGVEAFDIVAASSIKPGSGSIILLFLIVICCTALGIFIRFTRPRPRTRVIGGLLAAALAVASYFGIFTNTAVYASIPIRNNIYNMVNEFNSKGFIFAFIYHIKDLNPGALRPDGYSINRALEILDKYGAGGPGGNGAGPGSSAPFRPDVIFLMSEAFWDITEIPALDFNMGGGVDIEGDIRDPIPIFRSLEKSYATGEFYADVYGGGTDTTEFSLLTGHSIANFNVEIASAYKYLIRKDADSIVRTFSANGYSAVALHPGFPWFYNRQNVYPWLGFETFIDIGAFDEAADISGNYISDYAMTEKLINIYEEYTADGEPLFCFAVSIQNHGPYDAGYMYGEMEKNYLTTPEITLSIKSDYSVTNYVRGIQDADASLGRLTGYLESVERPVVLLFFGDHLPGLGSNFTAYKELGYPIGYDGGLEARVNIFRGRYLIWANGPARAMWPEYEAMRAGTDRMGAAYLGVYVMEKLGLDMGAYNRLVEAARLSLPVYHSMFYGTDRNDGAPVYDGKPGLGGNADADAGLGFDAGLGADGTDDLLLEILEEYRIAQYYKLFDEKFGED